MSSASGVSTITTGAAQPAAVELTSPKERFQGQTTNAVAYLKTLVSSNKNKNNNNNNSNKGAPPKAINSSVSMTIADANGTPICPSHMAVPPLEQTTLAQPHLAEGTRSVYSKESKRPITPSLCLLLLALLVTIIVIVYAINKALSTVDDKAPHDLAMQYAKADALVQALVLKLELGLNKTATNSLVNDPLLKNEPLKLSSLLLPGIPQLNTLLALLGGDQPIDLVPSTDTDTPSLTLTKGNWSSLLSPFPRRQTTPYAGALVRVEDPRIVDVVAPTVVPIRAVRLRLPIWQHLLEAVCVVFVPDVVKGTPQVLFIVQLPTSLPFFQVPGLSGNTTEGEPWYASGSTDSKLPQWMAASTAPFVTQHIQIEPGLNFASNVGFSAALTENALKTRLLARIMSLVAPRPITQGTIATLQSLTLPLFAYLPLSWKPVFGLASNNSITVEVHLTTASSFVPFLLAARAMTGAVAADSLSLPEEEAQNIVPTEEHLYLGGLVCVVNHALPDGAQGSTLNLVGQISLSYPWMQNVQTPFAGYYDEEKGTVEVNVPMDNLFLPSFDGVFLFTPSRFSLSLQTVSGRALHPSALAIAVTVSIDKLEWLGAVAMRGEMELDKFDGDVAIGFLSRHSMLMTNLDAFFFCRVQCLPTEWAGIFNNVQALMAVTAAPMQLRVGSVEQYVRAGVTFLLESEVRLPVPLFQAVLQFCGVEVGDVHFFSHLNVPLEKPQFAHFSIAVSSTVTPALANKVMTLKSFRFGVSPFLEKPVLDAEFDVLLQVDGGKDLKFRVQGSLDSGPAPRMQLEGNMYGVWVNVGGINGVVLSRVRLSMTATTGLLMTAVEMQGHLAIGRVKTEVAVLLSLVDHTFAVHASIQDLRLTDLIYFLDDLVGRRAVGNGPSGLLEKLERIVFTSAMVSIASEDITIGDISVGAGFQLALELQLLNVKTSLNARFVPGVQGSDLLSPIATLPDFQLGFKVNSMAYFQGLDEALDVLGLVFGPVAIIVRQHTQLCAPNTCVDVSYLCPSPSDPTKICTKRACTPGPCVTLPDVDALLAKIEAALRDIAQVKSPAVQLADISLLSLLKKAVPLPLIKVAFSLLGVSISIGADVSPADLFEASGAVVRAAIDSQMQRGLQSAMTEIAQAAIKAEAVCNLIKAACTTVAGVEMCLGIPGLC